MWVHNGQGLDGKGQRVAAEMFWDASLRGKILERSYCSIFIKFFNTNAAGGCELKKRKNFVIAR